jgi:hypothetical protein
VGVYPRDVVQFIRHLFMFQAETTVIKPCNGGIIGVCSFLPVNVHRQVCEWLTVALVKKEESIMKGEKWIGLLENQVPRKITPMLEKYTADCA